MVEHLLLKWGTLKGGDFGKNEAAAAIAQQYADLGMSALQGAAQQRDTPEQKQLLCDLIDAMNGPIENDWSGETMTKDEAKKYVLEYERASS